MVAQQSDDETHILNQIADVLLNEGAENFTIERLVAKTGLSRATLYRRFGGREALLLRLAQEQGINVADLTRPDARTRILQAAHLIFSRVGPLRATIEQVAQEADVGPVTVYRHFGSKEGLISAFFEVDNPRLLAQELAAGGSGDLEADLTNFAVDALRFIYERRDLLRLSLSEGEEMQQLLSEITTPSERTIFNLARYFEAQVQAGRLLDHPPQDMAFAFIGLLFSFSFFGPVLYNVPLKNPEQLARFAVGLFLDGLRSYQTS